MHGVKRSEAVEKGKVELAGYYEKEIEKLEERRRDRKGKMEG